MCTSYMTTGSFVEGLVVDILMEFFDEKLGKPYLVLFNRTFICNLGGDLFQ